MLIFQNSTHDIVEDILSLNRDEIKSIGKKLLLKKFHRFIHLWYIQNKLDISLLNDLDIMSYYTPCSHHNLPFESGDVVDGVLPMQAYCAMCRKTI